MKATIYLQVNITKPSTPPTLYRQQMLHGRALREYLFKTLVKGQSSHDIVVLGPLSTFSWRFLPRSALYRTHLC